MILAFEVVFASVAAVLSILSIRTLKAIKHLGVGRSFWIPVSVSGIFFLIGSIFTIFHEVDSSMMTGITEVVQVIRLFAICTLVYGIYSYSSRVSESLTEEFSIPDRIVEKNLEMEVSVEQDLETEASMKENAEAETISECKHQFGYLQNLSRNASIPDECLGCERIVECKHSSVKKLESHAYS